MVLVGSCPKYWLHSLYKLLLVQLPQWLRIPEQLLGSFSELEQLGKVPLHSSMIEITSATLAQVSQGRGSELILIEDDVHDVAKRLREIHDSLRLRYNKQGEYF